MDAIQFDQLPDLCMRKILAFLSLRDLLKCRVVNRQLKAYADSTQVTELVVDWERRYGEPYYVSFNWFGKVRQFDFEGAISLDASKFAKLSLFKLNQRLKFLNIHLRNNESIYMILNNLEQLIHLEILSSINSSEKMTLALPNLNVFAIRGQDSIILKTPKLEVLRCKMSKIQLEYPETIKRLECPNCSRDDLGGLTKLSSLETIHIEFGGRLDGIRLSDLADLKELHITCDMMHYPSVYVELRRSLLRLMHERSALLRDELKMYMNDVLLVDSKQFPNYVRMQAEGLDEFKFTNYRLLLRHSYPAITCVDFNGLTELDFEISEDFFVRFPRIQKLTAYGLVDQEQFEWFLQNATALNSLQLTQTRLDQAFVDRLPKLCSRLARLELYEPSGLITNIQFLLQFEQLEVFETDRPLHSFDLAAAFRQLEKLERLLCPAGDAFIRIQRSSPLEDNYSLCFFGETCDGKPIQRFATFDQENLSWAQVAALYEQRKAGLNYAPVKKMRIKRLKISI